VPLGLFTSPDEAKKAAINWLHEAIIDIAWEVFGFRIEMITTVQVIEFFDCYPIAVMEMDEVDT